MRRSSKRTQRFTRTSGCGACSALDQTPEWFGKINEEAAMSKNSGQAATVAVARDENGLYLGASAMVLEGYNDTEVFEAMA